MKKTFALSFMLLVSLMLVLTACGGGGGGGGGGGNSTPYTIGGTVDGLQGTGLVLQNNGGDDLIITSDGTFTFSTAIEDSLDFAVTVKTQPAAPEQVCTVNNGTGTVSGADVTNITVTCSTITYSVSVTATGIMASGLVLQNNGADDLDVSSDGSYTFSAEVADGADYNVTILNAPGGQTCSLTNPSGTISGADVTNVEVSCSTNFGALYPLNGNNWNDYVSNDGTDIFSATDIVCNTSGKGYDSCLHGGEMRTVDVPGKTDCTGLTATDALGVFDWACDAGTMPVRMVSTGLKDGVNLSDLIDFATPDWKANSVTVYEDATPYLTISQSKWWSNPVTLDNDGNNGTAMAEGDIYVITADPTAAYTLGASKVALVIQPGIIVNGPGAATNVVSASGKDFLWIEGSIDATGDDNAVLLDTVNNSVLRNVETRGATTDGLLMADVNNSRLEGITTAENEQDGLDCSSGSYNVFNDIDAFTNGAKGIYFACTDSTLVDIISTNNVTVGLHVFGDRNLLIDVRVSSNTSSGVQVNYSNNIFSGLTVANNGSNGITGGSRNVFSSVTSANNIEDGILLSSANTVSGALAANNGGYGIALTSGGYNSIDDLIAVFNGSNGVIVGSGSAATLNNYFTGLFAASNCYVGWELSTAPGIDDDPDAPNDSHDGVCLPEGLSDFTSNSGFLHFSGRVYSDSVNQTPNLDQNLLLSEVVDWTAFESPFRLWGRDIPLQAFPFDGHRGHCTSGLYCEIWDWRLATNDTLARDVRPLPTGDDTLTHQWYLLLASASQCAETFPGSSYAGTSLCESTFLRDAVEIVGDGIGNENALCESDETCLFTPNIGSYQGYGSLVSAGDFVDSTTGGLTGITLLKYETNGYFIP